ncbi:enolase-like protein ENO4 [Clonorchis sinensis]|uniref:phosphopyruvate hydratase n=1 Tax=Clonorchis sinensis TaxID=79923 RepID=G7YW85_CLOSI|nr:enolase-like protein ENO4 [Clonorchis sinensis]
MDPAAIIPWQWVNICDQLFNFKRELDQFLMTKPGVLLQLQCRNGAASIKMDLPEQPIDLVHECLNRSGMSDQFLIGIDLASSSIFDESKGRYEPIVGTLKTADELVTFYSRLLDKYKDICLLINPFRKEDNSAWAALQKNVGDQVLVVTSIAPQKLWTAAQTKSEVPNASRDYDVCYSSSGPGVKCMSSKLLSNSYSTEESETKQLHENDQFQDTVEFSGWMFDSLAQLDCFLVSELLRAVENLHVAAKRSIFAVDRMLTSELWPVDLAVGLGVHFLKIGGLAGEEHVSKLIHWMNIAHSSDEGVTMGPAIYSWANFNRIPDEAGET